MDNVCIGWSPSEVTEWLKDVAELEPGHFDAERVAHERVDGRTPDACREQGSGRLSAAASPQLQGCFPHCAPAARAVGSKHIRPTQLSDGKRGTARPYSGRGSHAGNKRDVHEHNVGE